MKKKLDVDLENYFKWCSEWSEQNIAFIKNSDFPFVMFTEWLETQSLSVSVDLIGKEIYFSVNGDSQDRITLDTYQEGVNVRKGIVEKFNEDSIQIDGKTYFLNPSDSLGYFFAKKDLLLSALHYDGSNIYKRNTFCEEYSNLVQDET